MVEEVVWIKRKIVRKYKVRKFYWFYIWRSLLGWRTFNFLTL